MKILLTAADLALIFYMLSFAGYNWRKKQRLAAIGAAFSGLLAFSLIIYLIYFGAQEL